MPLPRTPNTYTVPDGTTRQDIIQYFTTSTYNSNDDGYEWSVLILSLNETNSRASTSVRFATRQTVSIDDNRRYFNLITKFFEKSKIPILLNTSFNENEPIVNSPLDALECFNRTNMDYLVIENYFFQKDNVNSNSKNNA